MPAPRHSLQVDVLLVSQLLCLPLQCLKDAAKLWKGSLASWEADRFDSLITEEITRLHWNLKYHSWPKSSSWGALQTGELLSLKGRSCVDEQLWLKESMSIQLWLGTGDSHSLHRAEITA